MFHLYLDDNAEAMLLQLVCVFLVAMATGPVGPVGGWVPVYILIIVTALVGLDWLLILLFRAKSVKLAEISTSFRQQRVRWLPLLRDQSR